MRPITILLSLTALSACVENEEAFRLRIENVGPANPFIRSGTFTTAVDADSPGPIGPGQAFEVTFTAPPNGRLSFATMFAQSNDFFYAPDPAGIPLFVDGQPTTGDLTPMIRLWDAGTEIDQEPGAGEDQAPRQPQPGVGAVDPTPDVSLAEDAYGNLPATDEVIAATLTYEGDQRFTLRIENVSTPTTLVTSDRSTAPVPLSPGVWVVHQADSPLFTPGTEDRADGLEQLAEDGNPQSLDAWVAARTGVTVPFAPGVLAVHEEGLLEPLVVSGQGIEELAEDGDPSVALDRLLDADQVLHAEVFDTPEGASDAGPIGPGQAYVVDFTAQDGDFLTIATMFVTSNDIFLATDGTGIALFDAGDPIEGDVTDELTFWDAGTEVNQEPGIGADQAPFQPEPDFGAEEDEPIQRLEDVDDGFEYPAVDDLVRVTIEALTE